MLVFNCLKGEGLDTVKLLEVPQLDCAGAVQGDEMRGSLDYFDTHQGEVMGIDLEYSVV